MQGELKSQQQAIKERDQHAQDLLDVIHQQVPVRSWTQFTADLNMHTKVCAEAWRDGNAQATLPTSSGCGVSLTMSAAGQSFDI